MEFNLYNTMSRQVEVFEPLDHNLVGVYTCGPTVYHHAHIGNLRTYIASDSLVRTLKVLGYNVRHVMNITDVGHLTSDADEGADKMELGAAREGLSAWQIAERYTNSFFEQCVALNIAKPDIVCRATDHIAQQIEMIKKIEENGFTYRTTDGIYFDTAQLSNYGQLARLDIDGLRAGARVEVGGKRSKTDFALWKFTKSGEARQMEWDSPWGRGFPGWHIECSAMSTHYLGDRFDIHTGGIDHIAIHHTNEIAQSECATGRRPFVRYWMHSNFLQMGDTDERMAKSKGEFTTVYTLRQQGFEPLAFRLLCLKAHYRNPLKFTWDALESAAIQYRRLRHELTSISAQVVQATPLPGVSDIGAEGYKGEILEALSNDLATPTALTSFQEALSDRNLAPAEKVDLALLVDRVFGLELLKGEESIPDVVVTDEVARLLKLRKEARMKQDWLTADAVRKEIDALGYIVEDTPHGTTVKKR